MADCFCSPPLPTEHLLLLPMAAEAFPGGLQGNMNFPPWKNNWWDHRTGCGAPLISGGEQSSVCTQPEFLKLLPALLGLHTEMELPCLILSMCTPRACRAASFPALGKPSPGAAIAFQDGISIHLNLPKTLSSMNCIPTANDLSSGWMLLKSKMEHMPSGNPNRMYASLPFFGLKILPDPGRAWKYHLKTKTEIPPWLPPLPQLYPS